MAITDNIAKFFGIIGSGCGLFSDVVDGIGSSVNEGKEAVLGKIKASRREANLENAKEAIIQKNKACKEIASKLGITLEEAEKLLNEELK